MLYNEAWSKSKVEIKADPFSLESLIAWLEKMPAYKTYCYADTGHCLLGQYYSARGHRGVSIGGMEVELDGTVSKMPDDFSDVPVGYPRTFGAALTRAREALASRA